MPEEKKNEHMSVWKFLLISFLLVFVVLAPVVLGLALWIWSGIVGG